MNKFEFSYSFMTIKTNIIIYKLCNTKLLYC